MNSNIALTIIQVIIMIILFGIIILLAKQNTIIKYEKRIGYYSIDPLDAKDKSFADIIYDKYYLLVKKISAFLLKSKIYHI